MASLLPEVLHFCSSSPCRRKPKKLIHWSVNWTNWQLEAHNLCLSAEESETFLSSFCILILNAQMGYSTVVMLFVNLSVQVCTGAKSEQQSKLAARKVPYVSLLLILRMLTNWSLEHQSWGYLEAIYEETDKFFLVASMLALFRSLVFQLNSRYLFILRFSFFPSSSCGQI